MNQVSQDETRKGIIFWGVVGTVVNQKIPVKLFMDGFEEEHYVGTVEVDLDAVYGHDQTVDAAVQSWIYHGNFISVVKDNSDLAVLNVAQHERNQQVPHYRKQFRLLRAKVKTPDGNRAFILTGDRSDCDTIQKAA